MITSLLLIFITARDLRDMSAIISVHALHYAIRQPQQLTIIDNLNFTLEMGDSLAITGRSGSGKSTLLNLLAGLLTPTRGDIQLWGQSLQILTEDQRTQLRLGQVGFVFQDFQLLPMLTALENVLLPLELQRVVDAKAKALHLLALLGLSERQHHFPNQLSGGEQQRVALARAFVIEPRILFADEPTGNLDEQTAAQIVELLFSLQSQYHTTLVLVTHEPYLAQKCQHQLQLPQGTFA